MKRNEKLLAGGLGLLVVAYFGWPIVKSIYVTPVEERRTLVSAEETSLNDKKYKQVQLQVAAKQLSDWRKRGLPGDDLDAQRLYQQWLTDLAVASGLSAKVTPDRSTPVRGAYTAVQVTLEGQATFKELQTFLRRFHSVDLLHRVVRLDADSPAAEGDPELKFSLAAEGLRVEGTPDRGSIFPQFELNESLAATATELTLPAKAFASKPGDLIRLGTEFASIEKIDGDTFHLARASDGTTAADHPAGVAVELFPLRRGEGKGSPVIELAEKIDSPFIKPRKYEPRFDGFADQKLVRGGTAAMTVKVADYDAEAGAPKIELASGPEGLTFDAATGAISWTPPADLPNGEYKVSLVADVPAPAKKLEQTATITLGDPNAPPVIEPIAAANVLLGETLKLPIKATDAGPVTYKLDKGPEGAAVDASTGELTWNVPKSFTPGDVTVTVSAVDQGDPPQSAQQTFTLTVGENLKPFVDFSGSIREESDGKVQWQAWLRDRSSNRLLKLGEAEEFEAAGVSGIVREIGQRHMIYERNGERWRIQVGENLEQAKRLDSPVAEAGTTPPVEADQPGESPPDPPPAAASTDRTSAS